jgi:polyhydroxyalkanoate synthesis regulator protein
MCCLVNEGLSAITTANPLPTYVRCQKEFRVLDIRTPEDANRCDLINDIISASTRSMNAMMLTNAGTMDRGYQ